VGPATIVLAALVGASGCSLFDNGSGGGNGGGGGGAVGFGRPTLELTISGMHFGPSSPDPGSGVDLATSRDITGAVTSTTLTISASSASTGASCGFGFQRYGDSIAPFQGPGTYQLEAETATGSGMVAPLASETVTVPQGSFVCSGSTCDGAVLVLTVLASDHVEGSLSGTFADTGGAGAADVVCSFYLPTRSFMP
jgi:hypothetical protein